jgi:transposase-like protein
MNCPQCTAGMVQAKATDFGDSYWYCRACRKELTEMTTTSRVEAGHTHSIADGEALKAMASRFVGARKLIYDEHLKLAEDYVKRILKGDAA